MENKIMPLTRGAILTLAVVAGVFLSVGIAVDRILVGQFQVGGYRLDQGYIDESGTWTSNSCEHDAAESEAFSDGTERFLIHTGPDFESVCKHEALVDDETCHETEVKSTTDDDTWAGETVKINYREQHRICVTGMPGTYSPPINSAADMNLPRTYSGDVTRCFDLYDMGER